MLEGLSFGWRTAVLSVALVQLAFLALALLRVLPNRPANRTLAALLGVMALMTMPWLFGFAGFYDKWMWLTFAPFQLTLAVAPLGWLYVVALTGGHWPQRGPLFGGYKQSGNDRKEGLAGIKDFIEIKAISGLSV